MPRKQTKEEFIKKAIDEHKNKYTYNEVDYVNASTKVKIMCKVHGVFWQKPSEHVAGKGCKECGKSAAYSKTRKSIKTFIEQANDVHNMKYTYSNAEYKNGHTPLTITCPEHGAFQQSPAGHLSGHGCPRCSDITRGLKNTLNTEEFTKRALLVHGNKYNYCDAVYTKMKEPILIICAEHGPFWQIPRDHLSGSNCPSCAEKLKAWQFNPLKETILYYVYFPDYDIYKIGITNRSIEKRFAGNKVNYTVLAQKVYPDGYSAWKHEQRIIKSNIINKYDGPSILYAGNSEMFIINVLPEGLK